MPFKENDRPRKEDKVFKTGVGHCKDAVITLRLRNSRNDEVPPLNIKIKLDDNDAVQSWYQRFKHELKTNAFLRNLNLSITLSPLSMPGANFRYIQNSIARTCLSRASCKSVWVSGCTPSASAKLSTSATFCLLASVSL